MRRILVPVFMVMAAVMVSICVLLGVWSAAPSGLPFHGERYVLITPLNQNTTYNQQGTYTFIVLTPAVKVTFVGVGRNGHALYGFGDWFETIIIPSLNKAIKLESP